MYLELFCKSVYLSSCNIAVFLSGIYLQSMDLSSRTRRQRLPRSEAQEVVKHILDESTTRFQTVSLKIFRICHQGAFLKSKRYEKYLVPCNENILFHVGWMLWSYIFNGNCTVAKFLFPIDTKKGGTNRFDAHKRVHEKFTGPSEQFHDLCYKCRDVTSKARALGVILD